MRRQKTTPLCCPGCGERFSGHMAVGNAARKKMRAPVPGSMLICGDCGEISVMTGAGSTRPLTESEAIELPPDVVHLLAQCEDARQSVQRANGRNPFGRSR